MMVEMLDLLKDVHQHIADRNKSTVGFALRQLEYRCFRIAEQFIDVVGIRITAADDLCRRADQAAQHRFFLHDARIVINVRRCRHRIGKFGQIRHPAAQLPTVLVFNSAAIVTRSTGSCSLTQLDHRLENDLMRLHGKIFRSNRSNTDTSASPSRMSAPSTACSASMLCGGTRSKNISHSSAATPSPYVFPLIPLHVTCTLNRRCDFRMQFDRHARHSETANRFLQIDFPSVNLDV